jgi:MoaA/NifB/PqqE/SkfB family radical SAM enzyme
MDCIIIDNDKQKAVLSIDYNYLFNKGDGFFARWGETKEDDPNFSPFGCEIADIEISTGDCSVGCQHCYKSNPRRNGYHMNLDTFKVLFSKLPKTLTQIAFGITDIDANPDFLAILEHTRKNGVIPNFTLSGVGLTDEIAKRCSELCGALAVSVYPHTKDLAYDTVKKFTDLGMTQVNIHLLYHQDNQDFVYRVLSDTKTDERLEKLNCVVLLGLKPKGRATGFKPMCYDDFSKLVSWCFDKDIRIGFDSCSAFKFERFVRSEMPDRQDLLMVSESCESTLFSVYIDVKGNAWPCSFTENELGIEPVNVLKCDDFVQDVWYSWPFKEFRMRLLDSCDGECRKCIAFPEIND